MMELSYWHWLILGLFVLGIELFVPSMTAIWFGLSALVVGTLLWVFPDASLTVQLAVWIGLSSVLAYIWFALIKPKHKVDDEQAVNLTGEVATLTSLPAEGKHGKVRFSVPVMGKEEWPCTVKDDQVLEFGDRVVVDGMVEGNTVMLVKPA